MERLEKHIIVLQADGSRKNSIKKTGTGFFLRFHHRYFVITAGHVLDKYAPEMRFIFPAGLGLEKAKRKIFRTQTNRKGEDLIDVATIELDQSEVPAIEQAGYSFIEENQIELNHARDSPSRLIFTGFPTTGLKKVNGGISPESNVMSLEPYDSNKLRKMSLSPLQHIAGRFEKRKMQIAGDKHLRTARDPYGMSGGAVWAQTDRFLEPKFRLVGIGIEYRKKENALVAVKCSELGDLLGYGYPDLGTRMPKGVLGPTSRIRATL